MNRQLRLFLTAACLALAAITVPAHSAPGIGGRFEERLRQAREKLQSEPGRSPASPRRSTNRKGRRSTGARPSGRRTRGMGRRYTRYHRGRPRRRVRSTRLRRRDAFGRRVMRLGRSPRRRLRSRYIAAPARRPRRRIRNRLNPSKKVGLIHRSRPSVSPYRVRRARRPWRRRYRRRRPEIIMYLWVPRPGEQDRQSPPHDR